MYIHSVQFCGGSSVWWTGNSPDLVNSRSTWFPLLGGSTLYQCRELFMCHWWACLTAIHGVQRQTSPTPMSEEKDKDTDGKEETSQSWWIGLKMMVFLSWTRLSKEKLRLAMKKIRGEYRHLRQPHRWKKISTVCSRYKNAFKYHDKACKYKWRQVTESILSMVHVSERFWEMVGNGLNGAHAHSTTSNGVLQHRSAVSGSDSAAVRSSHWNNMEVYMSRDKRLEWIGINWRALHVARAAFSRADTVIFGPVLTSCNRTRAQWDIAVFNKRLFMACVYIDSVGVCGLQWQWLDLDKCFLSVQCRKQYKVGIKRT